MPRCLHAAAAFTAGAALLSGCADTPTPRAVILVTIDTCRADRFGCYDGPVVTPTLDRLAADGTLFVQALSPTPITLPSHLSLLTGLYPDRHTVRDNGAGSLPEEALTLAEILRDEGWNTAAFLSAVPLDSSFGVDQGFEIYNDDFLQLPPSGNVMSRLDQDQRLAADVTTLAVDWLTRAERAEQPHFAWVHYFDPHAPYAPPAEFAEQYGPLSYDGEVAYVDRQIARLLEATDENALVLVVADHGESLGDHGENTHGFFVYESALRVPWVIRGPGVPAATRVETPVSTVRVMPTLLDLLGIPVPSGLDGTSAVPLIASGGTGAAEPVFAEALFPRLNFGWAGTRSIRHDGWKLIEAPEMELYELRSDPDERHNVAGEHPEVMQRLLARLHDHADRGGALPLAASDIDPEMLQRLEGLGYLGAGGSADAEDDLWDLTRRNPIDMITVFRELEELPQAVLAGTVEEADAFVQRLLERDPGNVPILKRVSRLRLLAGHLDEAEAACREILASEPDDLETWRTLATAQLRNSDPAGAIESVRRGVSLDPTDVPGRLLLASLLADAEQEAAALEEYDRVLALSPESVEAVREKAGILSRGGRKMDAVRVLREHLPAHPDDVDLLNNLAWILADESIDPAAAVTYARRARALAPDDAVVLDTFGWASIRAGQSGDAVAALERALELTGDAEVRAHLGIALLATDRRAEGETQLREAVRVRPDLRRIPEVARWQRDNR